ncbi:hypothetical protein K458DRAFT_490424 [Lentithecium fluviatile CBS 122367]|uniref:Uncharacterized protein n=1 Tax=Lentithecium fluviatile CBS 122367 TaxID=1168545 RepID=A0A6G1INI9_9PLEO|nr:hypothetical protein K458DRAFT_490424 [Lentithecium fluviatile CBS 122367]
MDYLDKITAFANPPYNAIGSTLFLSYIILALYCTTSIVLSLYRQYNSISSQKPSKDQTDQQLIAIQNARKRHVKIYAFLASISFATLSYHMLSFLINSYVQWASNKWLLIRTLSREHLRGWMWDSTLFESFAKELVSDGASTVWTQAAILTTWFWNVWMAGKAQKHGFTMETMAPYIMLSQILPISFAAALFIIQLHLSALGASPISAEKETKTDETPQPKPKKPYKRTTLTLPTILLNAALICLPPLRNHPAFVPLVLLTRLILFMPYSDRISLRDEQVVQSISISGGFVVANFAMLRKVVGWRDVLGVLRVGGEAVKTLVWDAQISAVVYAVLGWGGGV